MVYQIYPTKLQLNKANSSDTETPFLDLDLSITNGIVSSTIYNKRDDFDFEIVNFPFLDGDVPRPPSYGVYILNKSENATLQYFIFCEKVLDKKYLLKLNDVSKHQANDSRNSTNLSLLMSELCSFLCFKLYSLNFAFTHVHKRLLCLSELVIIVLHKNTRKLNKHLKQAQKSILNLSNL